MKALFVVGIILVILGVLSFFIAVPQRQKQGIKIGGASVGVETTTNEKLPPWIGGLLVAGGIIAIVAGGRKS
jgi:uncharacterized membrane protein